MIREIEERTTVYTDEMVQSTKKVLTRSVYDDTRLVFDNLRINPEPGGSMSVSNYAVKKEIPPLLQIRIVANYFRIRPMYLS